MPFGIDVYYKNQTVTDPLRAKEQGNVQFAIVKTMDGNDGVVDVKQALAQAEKLQNAGIQVGPYHFAQPDMSATEQATRWYNQVIKPFDWDLCPWLDLEQSASGVNYNTWGRSFIAQMRQLSQRTRQGLYSSKSWFTGGQLNEAMFDENVPLWVARYYRNVADFSTLSWTDAQLSIYQYWDKGSVPGIIAQGVDLNTMLLPLSAVSAEMAGGGGSGPAEVKSSSMLMEEHDMNLEPCSLVDDGTGKLVPRDRCVTMVVPKDATDLILSLGWVGMTVKKIAFYGPTPGTGLNTLWMTGGAQGIAAGRSWRVMDGAQSALAVARSKGEVLTCEITYNLAPADVSKPDTDAVAGFR